MHASWHQIANRSRGPGELAVAASSRVVSANQHFGWPLYPVSQMREAAPRYYGIASNLAGIQSICFLRIHVDG